MKYSWLVNYQINPINFNTNLDREHASLRFQMSTIKTNDSHQKGFSMNIVKYIVSYTLSTIMSVNDDVLSRQSTTLVSVIFIKVFPHLYTHAILTVIACIVGLDVVIKTNVCNAVRVTDIGPRVTGLNEIDIIHVE